MRFLHDLMFTPGLISAVGLAFLTGNPRARRSAHHIAVGHGRVPDAPAAPLEIPFQSQTKI